MHPRLRVALISATAVIAGAALAVWAVSRDEPLPDISDLPEVRPQVADADNAFLGLLAVAQTIAERARADEKLSAALGDSSPASERDADQLAHVRTATADLLEPWREALARPHSVAPANRDALKPPYDFGDVHQLGRLAAIWCAPDKNTPPAETIRRLTEALRAARHVTESNDTLIIYLTGLAMTQLTLTELHDFVAAAPPTPDQARALIAALESSRLSPAALAGVLQNEVHFAVQAIPGLEMETYAEEMEPFGVTPPPAGAKYFHKPNQSIRWWAERVRAGLGQIDVVPISAIDFPRPDRGPATLLGFLPHPDNAYGRHYAAHEFIDYSGLLRMRPLINARLSALQAYVALRAEQAARGGQYPATLEELVPGYFPRVPVDAADAAPIRYARELRAIWSVGANNYSPDETPERLPAIDYRLPAPK